MSDSVSTCSMSQNIGECHGNMCMWEVNMLSAPNLEFFFLHWNWLPVAHLLVRGGSCCSAVYYSTRVGDSTSEAIFFHY